MIYVYLVLGATLFIQSMRLLRISMFPKKQPLIYVPFWWSTDKSLSYFYTSLQKRYGYRKQVIKGFLKGPLQTLLLIIASAELARIGLIHIAVIWSGLIAMILLTYGGERLIGNVHQSLDE